MDNTQYSLFEDLTGEPFFGLGAEGAQILEQENLQAKSVDALANCLYGFGEYVPVPEDRRLLEQGKQYYLRNIEDITKCLKDSGLSDEMVKVVTTDYGNALLGNLTFSASLSTMRTATKLVNPATAFMVDKYAFYLVLLSRYAFIVQKTTDYLTRLKNAGIEEKTRLLESRDTYSGAFAYWAMRARYINIADFAGIPMQKIGYFAGYSVGCSNLNDYGIYYSICKCLYLASPEQLSTIRKPALLTDEQSALEFAEHYHSTLFEQGLKDATTKYAATFDTGKTPQEREQEITKATTWNNTGLTEIIKISKNFNSIMQRPIEARKTRQPNTGTLPIRNYIEAFIESNQIYKENGLITEDMLQRTIGGLDVMRTVLKFSNVDMGDSHVYVFQTTLTEFSELCGMKDANQREKEALLACLMILKGLYIRAEFPYRVKKTKKGKKYDTGGELYVQVVNIPSLRYDGQTVGKFTIQITAEDLGGELTPITAAQHQLLTKKAKGIAERRFQAQLLGKDNKNEKDLVYECFGYAAMLQHATDEDIKGIRKYVNGHYTTARKKVNKWFEEYKEIGILTRYTLTENRAGEMIYKWTVNRQAIQETGSVETNAEIADAEQPREQGQEKQHAEGNNA